MAALLLWSTAWGSGLPSREIGFREGFSLSSLRYMLPAIGAATVAVALATRVGGVIGRLATGTLAVALAWSVVATARLGAPWTPPVEIILVGALAGATVLAAAMTAGSDLRRTWLWPRSVPASSISLLVLLAMGAVLTLVGNGFLGRYAKLERTTAYGPELVAWFLEQPEFAEGDGTIAFASRGIRGQLTGDHFTHQLVMAPQWASCGELERLARHMPIVITPPGYFRGVLGVESYAAPRCFARHRPVYRHGPLAVYRLPARAASP